MSLDFCAIDFETASMKRASACSVGIVKVKDGKLVDEYYSLINPKTYYNRSCIAVHGITPKMTDNADDYSAISKEILQFGEGLPFVAHNAAFDMSVMKAENIRYGLDDFKIAYFDSLGLTKKFLQLDDAKLSTIAEHLNIEFNHHNAMDDAVVAAHAVLEICRVRNATTIPQLLKGAGYKKYKVLDGSKIR